MRHQKSLNFNPPFTAKTFIYRLLFILMFFIINSSRLYSAENNSSLIFYGGMYTHTDLLQILLKQYTEYDDSYILTGGYNRKLKANIRDITFESEGLLVKHFGLMNHFEFDGLLIARYFIPVRTVNMSMALGEGLSLATANPPLENLSPDILKGRMKGEKSQHLLNFLMVEVDFGIPGSDRIKLFSRIHHRSGVFGTYCPDVCGSNFVSYGLKIGL